MFLETVIGGLQYESWKSSGMMLALCCRSKYNMDMLSCTKTWFSSEALFSIRVFRRFLLMSSKGTGHIVAWFGLRGKEERTPRLGSEHSRESWDEVWGDEKTEGAADSVKKKQWGRKREAETLVLWSCDTRRPLTVWPLTFRYLYLSVLFSHQTSHFSPKLS